MLAQNLSTKSDMHGDSSIADQQRSQKQDRKMPYLVAHVQRAHQLKERDLEGEVERGDEGSRAVGPPEPSRVLAQMITGLPEAPGQHPHLV
jgi:hypothetical protein